MYNLHTRKKFLKFILRIELTFLNISLLKTYNINTDHKSMMVSNKRHHLQNKIVQFIGQKKAWIGTLAILKTLKYKLSFWTSLKSKTQLIQFTDRQTGTLKCWNVGIKLSICDTTKSPPIYTLPQFLSMSEKNCRIYWTDSYNSLTSHNSSKSSKQFTVSVSLFLLGGQLSLPNFIKGRGSRKK